MTPDGFFFNVLGQSGPTILVVMAVLAIMSLASWAIIFFKIVALSVTRGRIAKDYEVFRQAADLSDAMQALAQRPGSIAYRVGYLGIRELRRIENADVGPKVKSRLAMENLDRTLRRGVISEMGDLARALPFLGVCANVAPLLGLFGTVWGIMRAFTAIGQLKSASIAVVAPGIAEALITTVFGLIVAIPAAIAYNLFLSVLDGIETNLINYANIFLNRVQRELPWTTE
jgi:biopolymer transport protein TolQ